MTGFSSALVTGAGGFIGRALVARLLGMGIKVHCLARPSSWHHPAAERIEVADFRAENLLAALDQRSFDLVFHLAAYGVTPGERDAAAMLQVNVLALAALCAALAGGGAKAIVQVGTCSEYAEGPYGQELTEASPLGNPALYGASKAAGALYAQALARHQEVPFLWLRLFGVYGPGEAEHRLPSYLIDRLARDEAVDLTPGGQMRDFLYIDDLVSGLVAAGEAALGGAGGPLNLCAGQPTSIRDVALSVARQLGKAESLLHFGARSYRSDEAMWIVGSNAKFRQLTGWSPRIALAEGIGKLIAARLGARDTAD